MEGSWSGASSRAGSVQIITDPGGPLKLQILWIWNAGERKSKELWDTYLSFNLLNLKSESGSPLLSSSPPPFLTLSTSCLCCCFFFFFLDFLSMSEGESYKSSTVTKYLHIFEFFKYLSGRYPYMRSYLVGTVQKETMEKSDIQNYKSRFLPFSWTSKVLSVEGLSYT